MSFKDKVILITGSTSGIGQGIAKTLLKDGAKVIINYAHNEKNADETRELFKDYKDNTLFVKADISDENAVIDMYEKIEEKFGKLDGLVNNDTIIKGNKIIINVNPIIFFILSPYIFP